MDNSKNLEAMIKLYSQDGEYAHWRECLDKGLRPAEAAFFQAYKVDRHARILNLGCGAGRETFGLWREGYHQVQGLDCTEKLLELARCYARAHQIPVTFTWGTAETIPGADASFDVVTAFANVYGHILPRRNRLHCLSEIKRILKPGGLVFLDVTSIRERLRFRLYFHGLHLVRHYHNPLDLERGDKKMKSTEASGLHAYSHWFQPEEVKQDAEKVGLQVLRRTTDSGLLHDPQVDSRRYRRQGRLIYILQK